MWLGRIRSIKAPALIIAGDLLGRNLLFYRDPRPASAGFTAVASTV
jgi:hypothetical protein